MIGIELNFLALTLAILIEVPTDEALRRFDLVPDNKVTAHTFVRSKDDQVVELYLAGLSYEAIGARTGFSRDTAYHTIKRLRTAGMALPYRCQRKAVAQ